MSNSLVRVSSLADLFEKSSACGGSYYYLAGGTDINVQISKQMIKDSTIFFIGNLQELKGIDAKNDELIIGAGVSFGQIIGSELVKANAPLLSQSLVNFASPLLQNTATIGGNIANGSPTADATPILLALDAQVLLVSAKGERKVKLCDYFTGYKQSVLEKGEVIKAVIVPIEKGMSTFYKKVSSRKSLTIAKVALAAVYRKNGDKFESLRIAVGSLNEYARRLPAVEKVLQSGGSDADLQAALKKEITPITDLRSDAEYRFDVTYNLIKALGE